jgi:predicted metalloprotease with PDZ domain
MQTLYREFYQEKKRGFTEEEFREVCKNVAGTDLTELFTYASTTKPIDYKKYFAYAGLDIDSDPKPLPGGWLGVSTQMKNDSLLITNVDYESPAWKAGLRRKMVVLSKEVVEPVLKNKKAGEAVTLLIYSKGNGTKDITVQLTTKMEAGFKISLKENLTVLQRKIYKSWIDGKK